MKEDENQIVVYQPDGVMRLEVRLENETVWLTQKQMAELFGCSTDNVGLHLKNIYAEGELEEAATAEDSSVVRLEGKRKVARRVRFYNLDAIISVGFRVNSKLGVRFRQWANKVLKDYLLRGYAVNERIERLERKVMKHDEQIELVLKTSLPPTEGVFYDGQLWDACSLVEKLIARAKSSILLIDSWVDVGTLDMLAKKRKGVAVQIVASKRGNKLGATDIAKFNTQYGPLTLKESAAFHDRFLILDDRELYLIGASLKDLGKKCFGFTKMDAGEIPGIKARV